MIRSLAPDCELYSVKVLGDGLSGNGRIFAAGLRWAIDNGMQVCNLSLGTTKRDFFGIFHELADWRLLQARRAGHGGQQHADPQLPVGVRRRSFPSPHMRSRIRTPSTTTRNRRSSSEHSAST